MRYTFFAALLVALVFQSYLLRTTTAHCTKSRCTPPEHCAREVCTGGTIATVDKHGCPGCPICLQKKVCPELFCPATICSVGETAKPNIVNGCTECAKCVPCGKRHCPFIPECSDGTLVTKTGNDGCPLCPICCGKLNCPFLPACINGTFVTNYGTDGCPECAVCVTPAPSTP